MQQHKFPRTLVIRFTEKDEDDLRALATRFDLGFSETARRALRVGTKFLREVNLPGSREEKSMR